LVLTLEKAQPVVGLVVTPATDVLEIVVDPVAFSNQSILGQSLFEKNGLLMQFSNGSHSMTDWERPVQCLTGSEPLANVVGSPD
jgi:hypothetical protein